MCNGKQVIVLVNNRQHDNNCQRHRQVYICFTDD
jgi:hypothetical protein